MNRFWLACVIFGAVAMPVAACGGTSGDAAGPAGGFVCGKDGKTYSVEDAARGEHDVEHRGRCEEPMHCGSPNDCFVGDECTDAAGFPSNPDAYWCVPGPTRCDCPGVFEPVCGGDSRNYINACEAACAGVGVRHEGYCEEPPGEGMCYEDADCPVGWICQEGILASPAGTRAFVNAAVVRRSMLRCAVPTDEPTATTARPDVLTCSSRMKANAKTTVRSRHTFATSAASASPNVTAPSSVGTSSIATQRTCVDRTRLAQNATCASAGAYRPPATAAPTAAKQDGLATTARPRMVKRSGSACHPRRGPVYRRTNVVRRVVMVRFVRTKTWLLLVSRCPSSLVTKRSACARSSRGVNAAGLQHPSSTSACRQFDCRSRRLRRWPLLRILLDQLGVHPGRRRLLVRQRRRQHP